MIKLQEPKYVYMGGGLRLWKEATLHVGCEAVTRSVNVFEGLKGYWKPNGPFGIVRLRHHYERLCRSARLLHIPFDSTFEYYRDAILLLASELLEPNRDMWFRTTLYAIEGQWGEGTVADLVITAYHQDQKIPSPIKLGVSTWRRSPDVSLPARAKSGANYQVARVARIEGRSHGWQDMVLLNNSGRVAEATGSCLVMVRDGTICTPPATEGALESITLDIVEALAHSMKMPFVRRPIDRTELLVADEIAICGTLAELVLVEEIEDQPLNPNSRMLRSLQDRFFRAARNIEPHPFVELTLVERKAVANSTTVTKLAKTA
jgi:branched-chain amino acid aminotransferase